MRGSTVFVPVFLLSAGLIWPGRVENVVSLPHQSRVVAMERDAAGNLYIAGSVLAPHWRWEGDTDAFVAKLSTDGRKVLYWTVLAGSQPDSATALSLAPDGSIVVVGFTPPAISR